MPRRLLLLLLTLGPMGRDLPAADKPAAGQAIDYARQVKPILQHRCWACHGALKQEAGLRLDASQLIRQGSDDGQVVLPGQVSRSRLWLRVTAELPERMPPEGKPLSETELQVLKAWIAQGADSPKQEALPVDPLTHWSFTPIRRPMVPDVAPHRGHEGTANAAHAGWIRNPIDAFVAARHATEGLRPRPAADRATLLRRLVIGLTGIPPTRDQLLQFLADDSPDAYERMVTQLLDSPLYGQRWGRHWMDVWRYSDWYGRRGSNEIRYSQRHIWRWRDWIIESLNENKGYDRMLHEMLAADELAPADDDTLRATGFLGRHWYKFDRNAWLFETVERTSQGLLGLTFRCARCHDHKFDPVTQEEYYRFRAFFEPHGFRTEVLSADVKTEVDNRKSSVLTDGLPRVFDEKPDAQTFLFIRGDDRNPDKSNPLSPGVPASLDAAGFNGSPIKPVSLPPVAYIPSLRPPEAARLIQAETNKVAAAEKIVADLEKTVRRSEADLAEALKTPRANDTGTVPFFRETFDTLDTEHWKVLSGQWSTRNGTLSQTDIGGFRTLILTKSLPKDFRVKMTYRHMEAGNPRSIGFSFDRVGPSESQDVYTAISPRNLLPSAQAFHRTGGKQHYPEAGIKRLKTLKVGRDIHIEVTVMDRQLTIVIDGQTVLEYLLPIARRSGQFALWAHKAHAEWDELEIVALRPTIKSLKQTIARARSTLPIKRGDAELARAKRAALAARLAAERTRHDRDNAHARQLAMTASQAERQVEVATAELKLLSARAISPSDPKAIDAATQALATARDRLKKADGTFTGFKAAYAKTSTGRRSALARWMTERRNPRTARVAVNQIWMRHTGASFVNTVSDFGIRSRPRDFPQLMDWLAAELIDSGWDMKHIHRLVVTSAAYRMTSSPGIGRDWARERQADPDNRLLWRMNSRRMEAEVVRDSLLAIAGSLDPGFSGPDIPESEGQTSTRRSLYFRTTPDNKMQMLELFDLANPNECYRRQESVVPQQALVLTNSPLALDRSRQTGQRLADGIISRLGSPSSSNRQAISTEFVEAAFQSVLGRSPVAAERRACMIFLSRHARLLGSTKSLSPFPSASGSVRPASTDPDRRAMENLVHVLVSHNDFVTIR